MLAVITAIAFIALIVASGIASVRYGWPQVRAWRSAFRRDPSAFDDARSGRPVAMAWSLWAVLGAGAFVGAAEAVAEGGAGTLAWSWLFAVLTSPLCAVAARAARTTSPGNAAPRVAGSLGAYFEQRGGARWHARIAHAGTFAWMFIAAIWAVLLTQRLLEELGVGTRGAAGNVGAMLRDPAWLACAAATLVGATLAMIEGRFVRVIHLVLGALGLLLVVAWMGVLVVGAAGDGAAAFVDAVGDAFRGAAPRGAWTGATAAEVAMSAITWLLPWFVLVIA
ncbi:MAG: hypothetical protein KC417_02920, partial [Myxococcales bacterium]|nr:hypothetical protein [Myxococcales bacterium]